MIIKRDPDHCYATVGDSLYSRQCFRRGIIREQGVLWCSQHAPSNVAERLKARHQRWRDEELARTKARKADQWDAVIIALESHNPELAEKVRAAGKVLEVL